MNSSETMRVKALETPINAEKHTAVYKMHRYFARRSWKVFERLVEHYSEEGDIILDPFCGGGVTVYESLKQRRRAIGVDLNPVATYITKMEISNIDLEKTELKYIEIEAKLKNEIDALYYTECRKCNNINAVADWFRWSNVFVCDDCGSDVIPAKIKKLSNGIYQCPVCARKIVANKAKRKDDILIDVSYKCPVCKHKDIANIKKSDRDRYKQIKQDFDAIVDREDLWYPKIEFPDCDRTRDDALHNKGVTKFYDFFTKRNLLSISRLFNLINNSIGNAPVRNVFRYIFTARLPQTSKMTSSTTHGWQHHGYWLPNIYYEMNVWKLFEKGYSKGGSNFKNGKLLSNKEVGGYSKLGQEFKDLENNHTCLLLTQSSHSISIPDNSVDAIITDPPFGGNVQYSELSNFWWVWLNNSLIDNSNEAVQSRHTGFETYKSSEHYEEMLYKIFVECHRVLKKDGWMVMTFHNKDLLVWMSLHRAARRAGFRLPKDGESKTRGILYQPPIEDYTTTLHQRAKGSMLGDFILSFIREDHILPLDGVLKSLSTDQERELKKKIEEFLLYQGGADENSIMTCIIPYLGELGLLHRIGISNFTGFLSKHFFLETKKKKWYSFSQVEQKPNINEYVVRPLDYIPAEEVVEKIIRSHLTEHKRATMDELLNSIFSMMVNSYRPGMQHITSVLNRICDVVDIPTAKKGKKKKSYFVLKKDIEPSKKIMEVDLKLQLGLFGESSIATKLSHNDIIMLVAKYGIELGFQIHIGQTEQRKEKKFSEISVKMNDRTRFGIASESAFKRIKEIDLLFLKDNTIYTAFEVTTSISTASDAINDRYRNLFAVMPSHFNIKCFVIVDSSDFDRAVNILYSTANIRDNLDERISLIKVSELTREKMREKII